MAGMRSLQLSAPVLSSSAAERVRAASEGHIVFGNDRESRRRLR
jgi:hypothetical protein